MQRHIADDGELSLLVDDTGEFLAVCMKCKRVWQGSMDGLDPEEGGVQGLEGADSEAIDQAAERYPMLFD